jgi:hypothetical protein
MALADLENENLLVSVPSGYKIDYQKKQGNVLMSEMVPVNETVNNWTEMVTVQIFYDLKIAPEQVRGKLEQGWAGSCPGSQTKLITQGVERSYPSIMWVMFCPMNPSTKKPEKTWVRGIQGADSFYLVQKAYKFTPSQEQEAQWLGFLNGVSVCDSRVPERACPKIKPQ